MPRKTSRYHFLNRSTQAGVCPSNRKLTIPLPCVGQPHLSWPDAKVLTLLRMQQPTCSSSRALLGTCELQKAQEAEALPCGARKDRNHAPTPNAQPEVHPGLRLLPTGASYREKRGVNLQLQSLSGQPKVPFTSYLPQPDGIANKVKQGGQCLIEKAPRYSAWVWSGCLPACGDARSGRWRPPTTSRGLKLGPRGVCRDVELCHFNCAVRQF